MPIIKDANYWREYNQKRRAYLTEKERQRRQKLKGMYNQDLNLDRVQPEHVQPTLSTTINHVQSIQPTFSDSVQPCTTILSTTNNRGVQPKSEIESYNQEIYRRAKRTGIEGPEAFFTFPNGQKIVRTKCGCNPTKDFYDWCLDSCEYFTYWRNQLSEQSEQFTTNE